MSAVAPSSSLLDSFSKTFFPLTWLQVMHVSEQGFRDCAGWTWHIGSQAGVPVPGGQCALSHVMPCL